MSQAVRPLPATNAGTLPAYRVRRISLSAFRAYSAASAPLSGRPVVLTGENGAGKTSVLEAISLLGPGKGLRGTPLSDPARRMPGGAAKAWAASAEVEGPDGAFTLGAGLAVLPDGTPGEKRITHLNGAAAPSAARLAEVLRVLWLTPAMDGLFTGSPGERRRFLDRLTLAFEPAHAKHAAAYERATRERLRLLKDGTHDAHWLSALEAQMALEGAHVSAARLRTLERLKAARPDAHGAFPEALAVIDGPFGGDAPDHDQWHETLRQKRNGDAESGRTAFGPHTSDLHVTHSARGRRADACSTGEQKALLIALVLSAARAQAREGAAPVLLLDEVAAHLDAVRRAALFSEILALGAQAFLTGADANAFAPLAGAADGLQARDGALLPFDL